MKEVFMASFFLKLSGIIMFRSAHRAEASESLRQWLAVLAEAVQGEGDAKH